MANKALFRSIRGLFAPPADAVNAAGGRAYARDPREALAQYALTGTLNNTYHTNAGSHLETVVALCAQVEPAFIGKLAVHARHAGQMKDMPALLVAYLTTVEYADLATVFRRAIDSPRLLRNVVQILHSGAVGRKSLGSRPRRLVREWLASRTDRQLFRAKVGNDPSIADIVKMVHPRPATESRAALYRYLIGKLAEGDLALLPEEAQQYEAYRRDPGDTPPDVPFELLTALPLSPAAWKQVARTPAGSRPARI